MPGELIIQAAKPEPRRVPPTVRKPPSAKLCQLPEILMPPRLGVARVGYQPSPNWGFADHLPQTIAAEAVGKWSQRSVFNRWQAVGKTRSWRLENQRKWLIIRKLEPTVRIGQSMPVFHVKAATRFRLRKQNPTLSHLIVFSTVTEDSTETRCDYDQRFHRQMSSR